MRRPRPCRMVALTAMQALFVHGRLERGQRVLVLGAGGGVGSFALQLARTAGAHVIAAARGWARDIARELGAERFVDVDLVFDLVGGDALARATAAVLDLNIRPVIASFHLEALMDHRKQAMILDGATDLHTLIRNLLGISRGDDRVAKLDQATERYLHDVLALEDRDQPKLHLVEGLG